MITLNGHIDHETAILILQILETEVITAKEARELLIKED